MKILITGANGMLAKAVREELIRQVNAPKEEDNSEAHQAFQSFMKSFIGTI